MAYFVYKDTKNEWRWRFRADNEKIIAVSSESYRNKRDCEHSISLLKTSANEVYIIDD